MKLRLASTFCIRRRLRQSGMTLVEIMTATAVFSLVIMALVSAQITGMKMFNITATKLSASHSARGALNSVRDEIRSGKTLYVGSGNATSFTFVGDNQPQQGNAVQIYPTANTNNYVRFFLNPDAQTLNRITSSATNIQVIARYITNQVVFRAEDFSGNVLTNSQNNRVIRMVLELYQWEFPVAIVGAGSYYDYYRLQTRITRRAIE
jgi:prepilin-type N-terminal cleavage/methylation domain-containing protein